VAPALQGEPVTGTFEKTQSPEQILNVVAAALGADLEPSDAGFRLVPEGDTN